MSTSKQVVVEMPEVDAKTHTVKFASEDSGDAMKNAYVSNAAVKKLGGCENGVKITIEAL